MPELFIELFSEEIPAEMQILAAHTLQSLCSKHLLAIYFRPRLRFSTPRRIAVAGWVDSRVAPMVTEIRGPKIAAPDLAIVGFLRKNNAIRDDLTEKDGHFLLRRTEIVRPAASFLIKEFAPILEGFPWPKTMRWGQSENLKWVRPLRRVVCLLDRQIVPISLGPVTASNLSEGHRFLAPGTFSVFSAAQWQSELRARKVIADAAERGRIIEIGLAERAQACGVVVVNDNALVEEVSGLVEYPVVLMGAIDARYMALPPEVRELSMKINQRYFATRDVAGQPAPFFAFVANIEAADGGAAIVAGNERVLRARLADAEHFWNLDRQIPLEEYLPRLKSVVFHAKLGSQFARSERISTLARSIAERLTGLSPTQELWGHAQEAGRLCKADLVTGMVGEFPELQGIIGGYYASNRVVGSAIRTHYLPRGPSDDVPPDLLSSAVALADKLDTLAGFFAIGERPSGSGDPFALRRSALGVIRIVSESGLRLGLVDAIVLALKNYKDQGLSCDASVTSELVTFILDRLRVYLRDRGISAGMIEAVLSMKAVDDIGVAIAISQSLMQFSASDDGANLLSAYRRAANILRIESSKDGPYEGNVDRALLIEKSEIALFDALVVTSQKVDSDVKQESYSTAITELAGLRGPVDGFFQDVTVNDPDLSQRRNRLRLLTKLRDVMHRVADFSKLEG